MGWIKTCLFVINFFFFSFRVFGNTQIVIFCSIVHGGLFFNVLGELKNNIHSSCLGYKVLYYMLVQGYHLYYSNLFANFHLLDLLVSKRAMLNYLSTVFEVSLFPHSTVSCCFIVFQAIMLNVHIFMILISSQSIVLLHFITFFFVPCSFLLDLEFNLD